MPVVVGIRRRSSRRTSPWSIHESTQGPVELDEIAGQERVHPIEVHTVGNPQAEHQVL